MASGKHLEINQEVVSETYLEVNLGAAWGGHQEEEEEE